MSRASGNNINTSAHLVDFKARAFRIVCVSAPPGDPVAHPLAVRFHGDVRGCEVLELHLLKLNRPEGQVLCGRDMTSLLRNSHGKTLLVMSTRRERRTFVSG
jgi:hypothetical protein